MLFPIVWTYVAGVALIVMLSGLIGAKTGQMMAAHPVVQVQESKLSVLNSTVSVLTEKVTNLTVHDVPFITQSQQISDPPLRSVSFKRVARVLKDTASVITPSIAPMRRLKRQVRINTEESGNGIWKTDMMYHDPNGVRTQLTDTASIETMTNNKLHSVKTTVSESGFIAPEMGLVMEYSGYIYVPVMYHMPHLSGVISKSDNDTCFFNNNLPSQDMIIELLKEKVGQLIPKRGLRAKRSIATAIIGGVAAWNRASIWSLENSLDAIDEQVKEMKAHSQIVTSSINTLIGNQQAIHHAVDRQARILNEYMAARTCAELQTKYFRDVYSVWLSMAPNDFSRVVDSALSGKITPDLLPATDVVNVLLKHPLLAKSSYTQDVSLLYELGRLALHRVDYEPYPIVSGVMVFPRIINDRSASMMRVFTTHFKVDNEYRKLIFPQAMACKDQGSCWSVRPLACRDTLTLTLCPKQNKLNIDQCLWKVINNKHPIPDCEWQVASSPSTEVIQFDGGVLVSTTADKGEILISQNNILTVHNNTTPSEIPFVLTAEHGDYFSIKGEIYQLSQETVRTGYDFKYNLTLPSSTYKLDGIETNGWIDEAKIPQLKSTPWAPPHHYTWWVVVSVLIILCLIACIMYYHRRKVLALKDRVTKEIMGWTTVPTAPPQYTTGAVQLKQLPNQTYVV